MRVHVESEVWMFSNTITSRDILQTLQGPFAVPIWRSSSLAKLGACDTQVGATNFPRLYSCVCIGEDDGMDIVFKPVEVAIL